MRKNLEKKISDFVGKGGLVPFEHGYKNNIFYKGKKVWGVSDTHLYFNGGNVELSDQTNLSNDDLKDIYNTLEDYLEYCKKEA